MTPEQVRKDRSGGRRKGRVDDWRVVKDGPSLGWVEVHGPSFKVAAPTTATDLNGQDYQGRHKDARRIARVPDLEAFYLLHHDAPSRIEALEAEVGRLREALNMIDAFDPEEMVYSCSHDALRGLVRKMGDMARAALSNIEDKTDG